MPPRRTRKPIDSLLKPFRVTEGDRFRLKDVDPRETLGFAKDEAREHLERGVEQLAEMQEKL